jgi:hypothetical protein
VASAGKAIPLDTPLSQLKVAAPVALNTTNSSLQTVLLTAFEEAVTVGTAFTITLIGVLAALIHPDAEVDVIVYEPAALALYVDEVAPFIATPFKYHCKPSVEDVESNTEEPLQIVVEPDDVTIGALGVEFMLSVIDAVPEQFPVP